MGAPQWLRIRRKPTWSEALGTADLPTTGGSDGRLEVAVLFTSLEATTGALERTALLLHGLNARINLVAAQTVPYPLALENPPVSVAFNERRLLWLAKRSPVETRVHLYHCRSRFEMLVSVLKAGSVLTIGSRRRWWPTWERKLARRLSRAGFQVIPVELS